MTQSVTARRSPRRSPRNLALVLALLSGLAGCEDSALVVVGPDQPVPTVQPPAAPRSPESEAQRVYFQRVQAGLLAQGLLRQDSGSKDTPFGARQLAENFIKIALFDEYVSSGGKLVARLTPSRLRRWEQPIRMSIEFGATVPKAQVARDQRDIGAFAARLGRATGHPIRVSDSNPNYLVLILNEDERRAFGPRLMQLVPGIDATSVNAMTGMPSSTFCVVFAFSRGGGSTYAKAVAVIRAEHPDALRLSCIHEELSQGMGLANDSPAARPSIFNDDEEFGLLTRHDEMLLRILYDRRLRPGMTEAEARPIVEAIALELVGGES